MWLSSQHHSLFGLNLKVRDEFLILVLRHFPVDGFLELQDDVNVRPVASHVERGGSFFKRGVIKGCGLYIHIYKFTYIVLAERGVLDDPPNPPWLRP